MTGGTPTSPVRSPTSSGRSLSASSRASCSKESSDSEGDACWVCLAEGDKDSPLERPCKCPRSVHRACLSRWQLQSAGRSEERVCRFCHEVLPDWRQGVTPVGLRPASPIMSIHHGGETYMVKVAPGPDGLLQFQQQVRKLLRLEDDQEFEISFECRVPGDVAANSSKMELKGMNAYDAAVYCASITAAERLQQAQQDHLTTRSSRSSRQEHGVHDPTSTSPPPPSSHPPAPHPAAPAPPPLLQSTRSVGPRFTGASPASSPSPDPSGSRHRTTSQPTIPLPQYLPRPLAPLDPYAVPAYNAQAGVAPLPWALSPATLVPSLRDPAVPTAQPVYDDILRVPGGYRQGHSRASSLQQQQGMLEPNASLGCVLRRRPAASPDESRSDGETGGNEAAAERMADDRARLLLAPLTPLSALPGTNRLASAPRHGFSAGASGAAAGAATTGSQRQRWAGAGEGSGSSGSSRTRDVLASLARARHSTSLSAANLPTSPAAAAAAAALDRASRSRRAASATPAAPSILTGAYDNRLFNPPTAPLSAASSPRAATATTPSAAFPNSHVSPMTAMSAFAAQGPSGYTSPAPAAAPGGGYSSSSPMTAMSAFASMHTQISAHQHLIDCMPDFEPSAIDNTNTNTNANTTNTLPPAGGSRSLRSQNVSGTHALQAAVSASEALASVSQSVQVLQQQLSSRQQLQHQQQQALASQLLQQQVSSSQQVGTGGKMSCLGPSPHVRSMTDLPSGGAHHVAGASSGTRTGRYAAASTRGPASGPSTRLGAAGLGSGSGLQEQVPQGYSSRYNL